MLLIINQTRWKFQILEGLRCTKIYMYIVYKKIAKLEIGNNAIIVHSMQLIHIAKKF